MSYEASELSSQDGAPLYLYEFTNGEVVTRRAALPEDYEWSDHTWAGSSLSHTEIKQSEEISKNGISLTFPLSDQFARQFLGYEADLVTSVVIRRAHWSQEGYPVYWKGRVSGGKPKGGSILVDCESVFTSMRRPGLRARFQKTCRHAHYFRGCNLEMEDWAVPAAVISSTNNVLRVAEAALQPDGWYLGGMVKSSDGSLRFITGHAGEYLTLSRPILSLNHEVLNSGYGILYGLGYGGVAMVKIYPGCDRSLETCHIKFDNSINCGCFKWIPDKNPMGGSSIL